MLSWWIVKLEVVCPSKAHICRTVCCRTVDRRREKLKNWRSTVRQFAVDSNLSTARQICHSSTARRPGTKFPVDSRPLKTRGKLFFFRTAHRMARATMTESEGAATIAAGSSTSESDARDRVAVQTASVTNGASATTGSNNVSAADASGRGSINPGNSTSRVVSPFSQHEDANEFSPQHLCPFLLGEPPVDGAYFDVPGADNQISAQVFEYSQLYRYIVANGRWPLRSFGEVRHPMNGGWVRRDQALALVRRVSVETQAILSAERARQGLSLVDSQPITNELRTAYQQMIASVLNP